MTFNGLQDELISEIGNILNSMVSENTDSEPVRGFHGYAHRLPVEYASEGDEARFFPFYVVRLSDGNTTADMDWWHVNTDIVIGICDNNEGGHVRVTTAMQRIVDRFVATPLLAKKFRAEQDIEWELLGDDIYPFYFGRVSIKFSVPKVEREDLIV